MKNLFLATFAFIFVVAIITLPYTMIGIGIFAIENVVLKSVLISVGITLVLMTRPIASIIKGFKDAENKYFNN